MSDEYDIEKSDPRPNPDTKGFKSFWNRCLKLPVFLYCALYTVATIVNSIVYLASGVKEDPSGNWHELDRAVLVLIIVLAFALIKYIKIRNYWLKVLIVYIPTMFLVFLYVFLRGMTAELASSAYRDVFINFTAGFVIVSAVVFVISVIRKKKVKKSDG
jgi:Na+/glutamate symporter